MADYLISTTTQQDILLTWIVNKFNTERQTSLTNQQFVTQRFLDLMAPYVPLYKEDLGERIDAAFEAATASTKQQVMTLLGVTP